MSNAFHLKIISPAAVVVDAHVPAVEIPGIEGDFGVLPGHSNVFSMVRPGVINVTMPDGIHRRFFAATGYADVTPDSCTVISDHIQDLADVSPAEAQEALVAAQTALAEAVEPSARLAAEKLVTSAAALVAALQ